MKKFLKLAVRSSVKSVAGVALGLGLGLIVCYFAGENPLKILCLWLFSKLTAVRVPGKQLRKQSESKRFGVIFR